MKKLRDRRHRDENPSECGWGVVVIMAAHLVLALQFGLMRCGGIFYIKWKNEFDTNDKETAVVDSIMTFLTAFSGFLGGFLIKRFSYRVAGILGGLLVTLGLFCRYWVNTILQMYITSAILGSGIGISYNSAMVAVAMYFTRRYQLALSIACAGIGTGIIAVPPLVQFLIDTYGWRKATLVVSAVMANCVPCCALFRPAFSTQKSKAELSGATCPEATVNHGDNDNGNCSRRESDGAVFEELEVLHPDPSTAGDSENHDSPKSKNTKPVVISVLNRLVTRLGLNTFAKSYRFALLCVLHVGFNMSYMVFVTYIVPYAQSMEVAPSSAVLLMSIFGFGSLVGRLGNGLLLSLKLSAEHVTAICMVLSAVSVLFLVIDNYVILAMDSFVHGFTSGFCYTVAVVFVRRFVGLGNLPVCLGLLQIAFGIGTLLGPIMAGWILDLTGSYPIVFYVISGLYFVCALQMLLIPFLKRVEPGLDFQPLTT